jgi:plastocyanin
MRHVLSCALVCALFGSARADEPKWVTIKGRVVFPADKPIPERKPLAVNAQACLAGGPILDETVIVDPKTRGVKNVVVYLRPNNNQPNAAFAANEIHPADAKRKPADVVIDQPCCMFVARVTAARVGDTVVVKNPAAIAHNFFWDSGNSGSHNVNVPVNGQWKMPNALAKEAAPIQYKCTIHPWMTGYVRVFDHPYFAVTDESGAFEIKDAPAGAFRIVFWHENGVLGGAKGRFGEPITIAGDANGTMQLKPTEFDVAK